MKYFKILLAIKFLISTNIVFAGMNVDNYLTLQQYEEANDGASEFARSGRKAYLTGLSDAFSFIAAGNNNTISFEGRSVICVPSYDVLTPEVLSSSIGRIIGTPKYPTQLAAQWKHNFVSQAAFVGLAQTFPCEKK
jgi:hypothetical protein